MSLRSGEIALLIAELAPLSGSRVDAVRVHAERLVTIDLRGPRGDVTLLLSAEPDLTRIHAATWRPPPHPEPLAFQVALRRELVGARLAALEAPGADRVVALHFERPAGGPVTLVAELTGRNGNALAPAARLVPVPEHISLEQAAAVMLQGMTAHYLAYSTYPLKPGDTAVVHAAAGGVGQLLVQIAKKCGAQVLATVSSDEKARLASAAGADQVIRYDLVDFEGEVKRLTGGRGVEVVYDGVGKTTFAKGLNCLKPRGYMVLYGQASGPVEPLDPQILNQKGSIFLTRPTLGHYTLTRAELLQRSADLFRWMANGELKVRIDRTFPLSEAASAHTYMEGRGTLGKVLLIP